MLKERLMTVQETAEYLQCSVSTVRRYIMRGEIPHYRLGKMVRFKRREIDGWLVIHREGESTGKSEVAAFNPAQLSLFEADDRRLSPASEASQQQ